jgi:hypothetical protein
MTFSAKIYYACAKIGAYTKIPLGIISKRD